MRKILTVNDVWHGMIGVADTIPEAIDGLIAEDYLNGLTQVNVNNFPTLDEYYGDNWVNILPNLKLEDLNAIFEDYLKFKWVVYWGH